MSIWGVVLFLISAIVAGGLLRSAIPVMLSGLEYFIPHDRSFWILTAGVSGYVGVSIALHMLADGKPPFHVVAAGFLAAGLIAACFAVGRSISDRLVAKYS